MSDDMVKPQLVELFNDLALDVAKAKPLQRTISDFMSLIDRDVASIREVVTNIQGHQEMVYKHFAELHTHTLHMAKTQQDIDALLASKEPAGPIADFVVDTGLTNLLAPIDPQDPAYDTDTQEEDADVAAGEALEETDDEAIEQLLVDSPWSVHADSGFPQIHQVLTTPSVAEPSVFGDISNIHRADIIDVANRVVKRRLTEFDTVVIDHGDEDTLVRLSLFN